MTTDLPENAKAVSALEQSVLKDENVALGGRLFRSVKIKGDRITREHAHWRTLGGKVLPRLIVVDTTGVKVGAVEGGDLTASNLMKVMKKAAARTYKTDLEKVIKESRSILDEMDQIEAKQKLVADKQKDAKAGKAKELAEEEARLAQQMQQVEAREAELLKRVGEDRKVTRN